MPKPSIPTAPSNVVATVGSATSIAVTWADNSSNENGFKIQRSVNAGAWALLASAGAGIVTYADTTVTAGNQYAYRVAAFSNRGTSAYAVSNSVITPALTAPTAPSALVATAITTTQIYLSWTSNSSGTEADFKIERSPDNSTWAQIATTATDVTVYTDSGLTASTLYYYRVRASNGAGDSSYCTAASATTLAAGVTYYTAKTGNDSNNGTSTGTPFLTVAKLLSVLKPGDTGYIRTGTYAEYLDTAGSTVLGSGSDWSKPVTVSAYPSEAPVIQASGSDYCLRLESLVHHVQFVNLIFDGTSLSGVAHSAIVYLATVDSTHGPHHIRFSGCTFRNITAYSGQCIFIEQIPGRLALDYNELLDCTFHDNHDDGTGLGGPSNQNHSWYVCSNNNLIDGCTVYNIDGQASQVYKSGGLHDGTCCSNNVIRNCTIHNSSPGSSLSPKSQAMILAVGVNNQAYNNVIYTTGQGIDVSDAASQTLVANNTIYGTTDTHDYGIRVGYSGGASGTIVRNNIVNGSAGTYSIGNYGTNSIIANNLTDKAILNSGTGATISANQIGGATFTNAGAADFTLQAGSLGIDKGITVPGFATDADGVARPQGLAWDIGAYELVP